MCLCVLFFFLKSTPSRKAVNSLLNFLKRQKEYASQCTEIKQNCIEKDAWGWKKKTLYIQAIDLAVIFYYCTPAKPNEIWNNNACHFSLLMAHDWLQV